MTDVGLIIHDGESQCSLRRGAAALRRREPLDQRDVIRPARREAGQDLARRPAGFAAAISGLRDRGTPYHLAHGLLDYAEYLIRLGDADSAALAIEEARGLSQQLRCPPLLDRAGAIERTRTRVRA